MCVVGLVDDLQILSDNKTSQKRDDTVTPASHYQLDLSQQGRTIASVTTGAPCLFMFQDMSGMKEANKQRQEDQSYKGDYYLNHSFFVWG